MNKNQFLLLAILLSSVLHAQEKADADFETLNRSKEWQLKFNDDCTKNWNSKWFVDGLRAEIRNTNEGMVFSAGDVEGDDACHAVLWTKDSFKGDVKIEYTYTRTDTRAEWVNILYIQATGIDPYASDIAQWNNVRIIPAMKTYFMNMKALHLSYAAYDENNTDIKNDYVRVRKYPLTPGQDFSTTEISPASFKTGLFNPGETYKITVIKTDNKLYFKVGGKSESKLFEWSLPESNAIKEGRLGLRHMYTRSARYRDFKVYTRK